MVTRVLFNYGGNAATVMATYGKSKEEAEEIYNNYMSGFEGLRNYQKWRKKDWWLKGHILLNPITKYRVHIQCLDFLRETAADIEDSRIENKRLNEIDVKEFYKQKASYDKKSINYPIQHAGAACSKVALINFFNWVVNNNYFGKVKVLVVPYDEINCEAPRGIAEEVAKKLYDCMVNSGKIFCTRCSLDADISKLEDGTLPNYWIH